MVTQTSFAHDTNEKLKVVDPLLCLALIKLWNSLPNSTKTSETFNSFKRALSSYFLVQYEHIDNFETVFFNI